MTTSVTIPIFDPKYNDFIILTESGLNDSHLSSEISSPKYQVFRHDRDYHNTGVSRGGGALICAHSTIAANLLTVSINPAFEDVWVQAVIGNREIIICSVYFPPNSDQPAYQLFINNLLMVRRHHRKANIIIAGDFNLSSISWHLEEDVLVPSYTPDPCIETLIDNVSCLELQQQNNILNHQGRLLDLIFCDEIDVSVKLASEPLSTVDIYHPPLEINLDIAYVEILKNKHLEKVFLFHKANFYELNNYWRNTDWSLLSTYECIDSAVSQFYHKLSSGINQFVPKKYIISEKYPKWYNPHLRKLMAIKNKLYKKYKKSRLESDYLKYSNVRKETKYHIDMCYLLYVSNTELMIPTNIKYFWSYINSLKKEHGLPKRMEYNGVSLDDPQDIANAFAKHFQSCYCVHKNISTANVTVDYNNTLSLSYHHFTTEEIDAKLKSLDKNKNSGPDGIPPVLLINCSSSLSEPLRILFQISLDKAIFPTEWKTSTITPIFKSGNKAKIENYRGIAIISCIPKVMESILTDELFTTFSKSIITEQHGFYKGRSTTTNLAIYHDYLVNNLEQREQVDVIYTDLSKAFDSVSHELLLHKLNCMGIAGVYLEWIKSYLQARHQCVKICDKVSNVISVTSGVPQGSHIGPVLFLFFVNDVIDVFLTCKVLMYADDLKFYHAIKSFDDCLKVQIDLDNFLSWCLTNHMRVNINKCKTFRFYKRQNPIIYHYNINNTILESPRTICDLGVTFDKDLSFIEHVNNITLKALRLLGFIKRHTQQITDLHAILTLYHTLVRSILEYNSIIWSPHYASHKYRLETVQNRFTKFYVYKMGLPYHAFDSHIRLEITGLRSLEDRRKLALLYFLHKLISGATDCPSLLSKINFHVAPCNTRHRRLFFIRPHRTNYGQQAFCDRMVANFNDNFAEYDLFGTSLYSLKKAVMRQ